MAGNTNKFRETQLRVETNFNGQVLVNDENYMNREMYKYNSQAQYVQDEIPQDILRDKPKPKRKKTTPKPAPQVDTKALEDANTKDLKSRNLK